MRANARLVTDALNAAVGVGLLHYFLDEAPHSLVRYTAFYQGLVWAASLPEGERRPLEDYTKLHLLMGMVRLLDTCIRFRPVLLPEGVRRSIGEHTASSLPDSKTYLSQPDGEQQSRA
jgi:hypothetical protein